MVCCPAVALISSGLEVPATWGGTVTSTTTCEARDWAAAWKTRVSSAESSAGTTVPPPAVASAVSAGEGAVCSETASTVTPASLTAAAACAAVVVLPRSLPSESSTIEREPSVPSAWVASSTPSYSWVSPFGASPVTACRRAARSVVGATTTLGSGAMVTSPTSTSAGTELRYAFAASFAASRRLLPGVPLSCLMLPLVSMVRTAARRTCVAVLDCS